MSFERTRILSKVMHMPHKPGLSFEGENQLGELQARASTDPNLSLAIKYWNELHAAGEIPVPPPIPRAREGMVEKE